MGRLAGWLAGWQAGRLAGRAREVCGVGHAGSYMQEARSSGSHRSMLNIGLSRVEKKLHGLVPSPATDP